MLVQDVLEAGRDEEVLLLDAQLLALLRGVIRVEHAGDVLGLVLGVDGGVILGRVERSRSISGA
jgi:hypothetical protein